MKDSRVPQTVRRRLPVAVCALALLALGVASSADAKGLRPPKWLKGPYRSYVLTYDATATMQGTENDNYPAPSGPYYTACDAQTVNFQGNVRRHVVVTYRFLFGHSKRGFAFVWKRASKSADGQATWTQDFAHPSGCPPDAITPDSHESCSAPMKISGDPPTLDFGSAPKGRHLLIQATLYAPGASPGDYSCTGNGQPIEGAANAHFSDINPSGGAINFTDNGVKAKRTFSGKIDWIQDPPMPNGPGSTTDDLGRQYDWNFTGTESGTFKLAPGR